MFLNSGVTLLTLYKNNRLFVVKYFQKTYFLKGLRLSSKISVYSNIE